MTAGVTAGERFRSWADIQANAARGAGGFVALGLGEDDSVALMLRNDFPTFEVNFAAGQLGIYAVPINWHFTPEEAGYILADSGAKVLVAHSDLLAQIASGIPGFLLLVLLTSLWGVVYAGFMQLIALKTRSAAATNSGGLIFFPLLFLTPNFVPRDMLTEPMEVAATINPVTYLMEALRSLILDDLDWDKILPGFAVVAVLGVVMLVLNVRMIRGYD